MAGTLTMQRVESDIEVLARAGLETSTFVEEFEASLVRAVPYRAMCLLTLDPASCLLTGTYKFGQLIDVHDRDQEWATFEYGRDDPTTFRSLITRPEPATAIDLEFGKAGGQSPRFSEFLKPSFGFADELRMVARHGTRAWGGVTLFRDDSEPRFTAEEVAFVAGLSESLAAGLRSGLLAKLTAPTHHDSLGPVVIIVDADDELHRVSHGAEDVFDALATSPSMSPASAVLGGLVVDARRFGAGHSDSPPRARIRLADGRWLLLHASPLAARDGISGEVVITIEEARPPEIVPLVVAAFDLTARERDVTNLVLQGHDTKEIAAALYMSRYTVQDHLKSIFDKAGVRSRRELVARIFFDQYCPRLNGDLAPTGWYSALPAAD